MDTRKLLSRKVFAGWVLCFSLTSAWNAQAKEPAAPVAAAAAPVAAGAAVAAVVLTAIGGLSTWLLAQADDTAAAALGAASGKHGTIQNENKDTGFLSSNATATGSNLNGTGEGTASAVESLFGSWAGALTTATASAFVNPLHARPDNHQATGFATASVDGRVRTTTVAASALDPASNPGWDYTPATGVAGDVWLTVAIPTNDFHLRVGTGEDSSAQVTSEYSVQIDGATQFFAGITLDDTDGFKVNSMHGVAGLDKSLFTEIVTDGLVELMLAPNAVIDGVSYYVTDIFINHLALPDSGGGLGETAEYAVTSNVSDTAVAFAAVPEPSSLFLAAIGVLALPVFSWQRRRARV